MRLSVLKQKAAALSEVERAQLIDFLWTTLTPEAARQRERAWSEEAEWRAVAVEQGRLPTRAANPH